MLIGDLYKITFTNLQDTEMVMTLELNRDHAIFEGHFPGQPVLPGAVMLQMIKEVLEIGTNRSIRLKKADQMKFLGLIDPQINNVLQLNLSYNLGDNGLFNVTANIVFQNNISFKFKGTFVKL